jgi:hypothetical protein
MDHDVVVRQKMTERYLLDELDPEARDEFEEHFFACRECAQDVHAASVFVERSKVVLAEPGEKAVVPAPAPDPRGWLAWLWPAIAAPALALLLAVVGYQNLVTLPRMTAAISSPHVLHWTSVNVGTFGEGNVITTTPGSGFLLFVRIPPEGNYASYKADLYDPAGKLEWTLAIPAVENQDQWPVQVPAAIRPAGTYTLSLDGITPSGDHKKVGQASFELQFQK